MKTFVLALLAVLPFADATVTHNGIRFVSNAQISSIAEQRAQFVVDTMLSHMPGLRKKMAAAGFKSGDHGQEPGTDRPAGLPQSA